MSPNVVIRLDLCFAGLISITSLLSGSLEEMWKLLTPITFVKIKENSKIYFIDGCIEKNGDFGFFNGPHIPSIEASKPRWIDNANMSEISFIDIILV